MDGFQSAMLRATQLEELFASAGINRQQALETSCRVGIRASAVYFAWRFLAGVERGFGLARREARSE